MRVLLIHPPWILHEKVIADQRRVPIPLGAAYIASIAEKNGCEVKILDCLAEDWNHSKKDGELYVFGLEDDKITQYIKDFDPDVIGVTCSFSSQAPMVHNVAKLAKMAKKDAVIILGGAYATFDWQKAMKDKNIDYAVIGEGEKTFEAIIKSKLKNIKKIKGIVYREKGKIKTNGESEKYENIDDIPFPAWHLVHMEKYFEANKGGVGTRMQSKKPGVTMITSRGCPFGCIFCSIYKIWGRKWRYRSAKNVADELELLVKTYGIKNVEFEDDCININRNRFIEICNEIINRKLNIKWETPNGLRADLLDEEVVKIMKKSGCSRIRVGVENGNQEFLNQTIRKNLDLKKVERAVELCRKYKILIDGSFVFGVPGETKETMDQTLALIKNLSGKGMNCLYCIAMPIPNTTMYDICKDKNYLVREPNWREMLLGTENSIIKTENFTPEDVERYYNTAKKEGMIAKFKSNPFSLFNTTFGKMMIENPKTIPKVLKYAFGILRRKN